jgi:hypothetical protein
MNLKEAALAVVAAQENFRLACNAVREAEERRNQASRDMETATAYCKGVVSRNHPRKLVPLWGGKMMLVEYSSYDDGAHCTVLDVES